MLRIIRERMQTFAYVHQIGRTRLLGTMPVIGSTNKPATEEQPTDQLEQTQAPEDIRGILEEE
mgnify:CR=1 FL=1